jgi:fructosamine-3-kinase
MSPGHNKGNKWGLALTNYLKARYYMQDGNWKEANARMFLERAIGFFTELKHLRGIYASLGDL